MGLEPLIFWTWMNHLQGNARFTWSLQFVRRCTLTGASEVSTGLVDMPEDLVKNNCET